MLRTVLVIVVTALIVVFTASVTSPATPMPAFAPGQMWSIKSETTTTAKVIIGRVEKYHDRDVVHISVIDIPIPSGAPDALRRVAHMPFERSALANSVDELLATNVPPDPHFESGYEEWRRQGGGIFTISVSEIIAALLEHLPGEGT